MCGINGFWLRRPLTEVDVSMGRKIREALFHRGPDGKGEWLDRNNGIYFGHRRLAIIDLREIAGQPMVRDGLVCSYNGELYNYQELRKELVGKGHHFETSSDTEVLLAAWQEWGEQALDRFDGMFAFALYDKGNLHLITDPFGEKPLFLVENHKGIYFSSEANSLIMSLGLQPKYTKEALSCFLALGHFPPPETGYAGLELLPPATHLVCNNGRIVHRRTYWQHPRTVLADGDVKELNERELDEISDVLVESLRRRVRADVPIGMFLSAGTDSVLLAALAAKELGIRLDCYTVSFSDGADESEWAVAISKQLNLHHEIIDSQEGKDWKQAPEALINLYGIPNDNLTALSVRQMCAAVRGRLKVALSGAGGDEIFYGYSKYYFLDRWRRLYRLPGCLFTLTRQLSTRFLPSRLNTASELLAGDGVERYLRLKNGPAMEVLKRAFADYSWHLDTLSDDLPLSLAVREHDLYSTLPASYLAAIDRGSMRESIEVRSPFLSRRLAELAATHDQRVFLRFGRKSVLRRLVSRYLPEELLLPRKQGFVFPSKRYLAARNDRPPKLIGLDEKTIETLWRRRLEPFFDSLALRLTLIESMQDGVANSKSQ